MKKLKSWLLSISFAIFIFSFALDCYAKEIVILYTGQSHAMLYPCSCPIEPDGGIARRATLIKTLRTANPNTLLLDSGAFFAGGILDEYSVSPDLDMQRTDVQLKAIGLMKYDALGVSGDEFNFGKDFLMDRVLKSSIPFLSCNISDPSGKKEFFKPYIIKEIEGVSIGIIGVSNFSATQKLAGFKYADPNFAVKQAVGELKQKGVDVIVLLSQLSEGDDANLINNVGGIDIVVVGSNNDSTKEGAARIGPTLVLRPPWQGRRMGKLTLAFSGKKISDFKVEEIRLWDKIKDDSEMLSILPRCFSEANCKKQGFVASCINPGSLNARCMFSEPAKVNLLILAPKVSKVIDTQRTIDYLKTQFPGLTVSYVYYPGKQSEEMIRDFGIKTLPVYFLSKNINIEKAFDNIKGNLEIKGDYYMINPQFSGVSFFLGRKKMEGRIDLFLSLYDKNAPSLLGAIKDFKPNLHFLALEQKNGFESAKGNIEVEEYLRAVCVQKYYPGEFWDYLICRSKNIDTSYWDDCLKGGAEKIKACAVGPEGKSLLRDNISLNKEFQIMFGPTYLLDNQEIFGTQGVPTKDDFGKIFKK